MNLSQHFFVLHNIYKAVKSGIMIKFVFYQPVIVPFIRKGKSGQHRAAYRLIAGFFSSKERESATENNCLKQLRLG